MSNRHYYEGLMELIGFIFHMAAHGRDELIRILLVHSVSLCFYIIFHLTMTEIK